MVKITAFVIVLTFIFLCLGYALQINGVDISMHMPDLHKFLSTRLPTGLGWIKRAFVENPFAEVYNLYIDEDLSTLEAVLKTVPTFVVSSFQFMEYVVKGFHNILIRPWFEFKTVNVDRSPYI